MMPQVWYTLSMHRRSTEWVATHPCPVIHHIITETTQMMACWFACIFMVWIGGIWLYWWQHRIARPCACTHSIYGMDGNIYDLSFDISQLRPPISYQIWSHTLSTSWCRWVWSQCCDDVSGLSGIVHAPIRYVKEVVGQPCPVFIASHWNQSEGGMVLCSFCQFWAEGQ